MKIVQRGKFGVLSVYTKKSERSQIKKLYNTPLDLGKVRTSQTPNQ